MAEYIREILKDEQDHLISLATALGEEVPVVTSAASAAPPSKRPARPNSAYIFAGAATGILLFCGTGSLPSAAPVSAMNCGSSRREANTASTRASIISFERTASYRSY